VQVKDFRQLLTPPLVWLAAGSSLPAAAQSLSPNQQLGRDIFKELVEISTVTATGDTLKAAEAMAARLKDAGFPDADAQVLSPAPRKANLVARLHGSGARRPILLLAHLDVVEAMHWVSSGCSRITAE
jgi:acetylornithine deacetylase/succinyl-diaminopimelate desuccinylase-like protein